MDGRQELRNVAASARVAEQKAAPWIEALARFGYAAKGVVYAIIGFIAARAALSGGGDVEGWSGSIDSLRDEPFGAVMLWLIGLGLFGYVVWRAVAALRNPENESAGHRVFYLFSALAYSALALEAIRAATGGSASGEDTHWSATLMDQPFGRVLVAIVGAAIAGYGLHQLWRAWTVDLDDRLDLSSLSAAARAWVIRFGRFGIAARGIVLVILGYMFLRAAQGAGSAEAGNVEGVLESMRDQPWLLAVTGLGFIAYGLFNLVRARYRRIRVA